MADKGGINIFIDADALAKQFEYASEVIESEVEQAISDVANATYANIIARAQAEIHSGDKRQDYIKGLELQQIDPLTYVIVLDGTEALELENGFPAYDMRSTLLSSQKTVEVGSRAGEKWVQSSRGGSRFAHVPITHQPSSQGSGNDLAQQIKTLTAQNAEGRKQRITKTFKDIGGNPLTGKVAVASNTGIDKLEGLVKYQDVSATGSVQSVFVAFRTISDRGGSGWQHPGHPGYQFFGDIEQQVENTINNVFSTLFS